MKFDVVIGNPPYQKSIMGKNSVKGSATAIYHLFVNVAINLNPNYISMIIPSRWMTRSASGVPDSWVDKMINNNKLKEIHDFLNSEDCFNNVSINGGVNYFLWDKSHNSKCNFHQHENNKDTVSKRMYLNTLSSGITIRNINALGIVNKIYNTEGDYLSNNEDNFSSLVSPSEPFSSGSVMRGNWRGFYNERSDVNYIKYYTSKHVTGYNYGWVSEDMVLRNKKTINLNKLYITTAGGNDESIIAEPKFSEPNSICSGSYLIIGYDYKKHNFTKSQIFNVMSYMKTKFFRYLVSLKKKTQHGTRKVYQFVPLQDFNKPWTDKELYKKYNLSIDEINIIESSVSDMYPYAPDDVPS